MALGAFVDRVGFVEREGLVLVLKQVIDSLGVTRAASVPMAFGSIVKKNIYLRM